MKARYDDITVTLSRAFVAALHDLMRAEMAMMRKAEPKFADCWTWGKCTVGDLCSSDGLTFEFGGEDDKPEGMKGDVLVVSNTRI